MLAGCGGSQLPVSSPGAMAQSREIATHTARSGSWMLPEAKGEDLLYVAGLGSVIVYSYPKGKRVGTLKGFYRPEAECADSAGDVFITDGALVEYRHGGKKPVQTFTQSGYAAGACASDPTTGDLAVTWAKYSYPRYVGYVAVYHHASGSPKLYSMSGFVEFYCGYDHKSNLFCDGLNYNIGSPLVELLKGGKSLRIVRLNQSIGWGYSVQWDGKYLTVQDVSVNKVYRFAISGSTGTLRGTVDLPLVAPQYNLGPTWIIGDKILGACIDNLNYQPIGQVLYYAYPKGGSAIKIITVGDDTAPDGVTVSVAPNH
jgi:hypothetical protein